jgi:UDP-N-acetylglucosamine 2-epimerase (non-hydrolysing)
MIEFEKVLIKERPDLAVVVGDVNSTIACALTASKLNIKVAHVEAGLRSYDRTMPEEVNRVLTDAISDYLFITERSARDNLVEEGIAEEKIFFVGNVMIDTLLHQRNKALKSEILNRLKLKNGKGIEPYALLTLHRPSNVDDKATLIRLFKALKSIQGHIKVIYPCHPRARRKITEFGLGAESNNGSFLMTDPLGYLDFLHLMSNARLVLTDSGGIQEETTVLGIPCITLRENTERPITIMEGTNVIVGSDANKILRESLKIINGKVKTAKIPELWDGQAAKRIVKILLDLEVRERN